MANMQNRYETIMVFSVLAGEDTAKALVEKFSSLIAENSTIDNEEDWGKRRLAYPIQDELDGYYYLIHFTADPAFPAELDRVLKITDGVLRSLIIRMEDEDPAKAETKEPTAEPEIQPAAPETAAE